MKKLKCGSALALTVLLCGTALVMPEVALAQPEAADPLTDTIIVTGQRTAVALEQQADPVAGHATAADAAALVAQLPGAALVNNGALSGQVQYRGLFSERLSVHVGGQDFQSGGPNAMDPPLHYVPVILLDRITVSRGAAPVSDGPGLGAAVNARLKQVGYSDSASMTPALDLAASYRSADDGLAAGGVVGLASDTYRVNAIASWEEGDDYRFPGGRVRDTGYERLSMAFRQVCATQATSCRLICAVRKPARAAIRPSRWISISSIPISRVSASTARSPDTR